VKLLVRRCEEFITKKLGRLRERERERERERGKE
jgi:hypothetical protein